MSEQKWITITVPVEVMPASSPSGDASGTFESFEGDGDRDARRGLWVRHDGREMRARNVHLVAGMARAWPVEPPTDWQERVLAEALLIPISSQREERERCAAEIVRYGIPAVAFAIDRAWNEGADAERAAAARAAKVKPTTDYAKKLAAIDARIALYDGGPIEKEHADRGWLLAQLRAVETALTAAGIPDDGRAPAERIVALQVAKVTGVGKLLRGAAMESARACGMTVASDAAADILQAAEMLKRWENGATVEHDCKGSPTCPMCVPCAGGCGPDVYWNAKLDQPACPRCGGVVEMGAEEREKVRRALAPSVRGPVDAGLHVEEPVRLGVEQAEHHGFETGSDRAHAGSIAAAATSRKENRPASPIAPEPPPAKTGSTPVWPLVFADVEALGFEDPVRGLLVADMHARDAFGREKYGTPLTSDNGRDHLHDAYQEVLDECVYLRAAIDRGDPTGVARELYVEAIHHAVRLRVAIEMKPEHIADPTSSPSFARAMAREEEGERPWHRDRAVVVRTPNRLDEEAARRAAKEVEALLRPAQPPPDQAVDEPAVGDGGSAP